MPFNGSSQYPTVAVVYHFFAHYRSAILERMVRSRAYHYLFVGDIKDPTNSGIKEWTKPASVQFIYAPCRFLRGRYLIQRGLLRLAWDKDIQAIIFLGDVQFLTTWLAAALARLRGKRVLFWTHGWTRPEFGPKDSIRCTFYRLAHGLLLYGSRAREMAIQRRFRPENLYIIYNSLDYEQQKRIRNTITPTELTQVRSELFGDHDRPMVICPGRLVRSRRLDLLMQAMAELKQQGHCVNLLLVGDGTERESLSELAIRLGVSVNFYGACYDEERLARLIMAANVTIAPGGVGLTVVHSLTYGVPVVTNDNPDEQGPEWEAIIPGKNGAYFRQNDTHDLARCIKDWTQADWLSEDARQRCYEIVERLYNPEYQIHIIEQALTGKPAQTDSIAHDH
ncbi:Putative glycosyltransferase EpsD [Anaerolineae bacterium]|nr:Putative glycosyltransferase EpsD [Anaerolineae bacterium]